MADPTDAAADIERKTLPHPLPFSLKCDGPPAPDAPCTTLFDALGVIQRLYHEGMGTTPGKASAEPPPFFVTSGSGPAKKGTKPIALFTAKTQVVPGGILQVTESIAYPTPQGMTSMSRAKVSEIFDGVFITDLLKASTCGNGAALIKRLGEYSYQELDEMRFAFAAIFDLVERGNVFEADGKLTGLAKRDLKKNCKAALCGGADEVEPAASGATEAPKKGGSSSTPSASAAAPAASGGKKGGLPQPAKLGAEERQMKAILLQECGVQWPHTPPEKSAQFVVEQDPDQPKHKPLFRAAVTLVPLKKMVVKGEWCRTRKDAENSAAEAALRQLHSGAKPK